MSPETGCDKILLEGSNEASRLSADPAIAI